MDSGVSWPALSMGCALNADPCSADPFPCLNVCQCQAGSQVSAAHGASGKQEHLTLAAGSAGMHLAAPQLVTPSVVLCADGSRAVQLVLAGPGLASLGAVLHCRSRGRHQIVTVLRVRRGLPSALAARLAHAAEDEGQANAAEAPDTPSSADRISPHREAEAGSKPPRHGAEGPSSCLAARHARPPPTEAEHAFERLELPPGQDAVLVQLAAPAAGWGLLELELASGALDRAAGARWVAKGQSRVGRARPEGPN